MTRAAVFLDRDGTIIEDTGFVRNPETVRLLPDAAEAIARLRTAGLAVVVVTNQSGLARGLITPAQYAAVEARVTQLLAQSGAVLDGVYVCPHHPSVTGHCACRKPGTLLYQQAAAELGLDLSRSWWVGDRIRDVLPARAYGGRALLLAPRGKPASRFQTVPSLLAAAEIILLSASAV
jgi:histidinol-phosphate phosphatase family protein